MGGKRKRNKELRIHAQVIAKLRKGLDEPTIEELWDAASWGNTGPPSIGLITPNGMDYLRKKFPPPPVRKRVAKPQVRYTPGKR